MCLCGPLQPTRAKGGLESRSQRHRAPEPDDPNSTRHTRTPFSTWGILDHHDCAVKSESPHPATMQRWGTTRGGRTGTGTYPVKPASGLPGVARLPCAVCHHTVWRRRLRQAFPHENTNLIVSRFFAVQNWCHSLSTGGSHFGATDTGVATLVLPSLATRLPAMGRYFSNGGVSRIRPEAFEPGIWGVEH